MKDLAVSENEALVIFRNAVEQISRAGNDGRESLESYVAKVDGIAMDALAKAVNL